MKALYAAAALAAALTLATGPALAQTDCFRYLNGINTSLIAAAERAGDMANAAKARQYTEQGRRLWEQGRYEEAILYVGKSMEMVGGHMDGMMKAKR